MTIAEIRKKYHAKIGALDLELIIAHEIGKTREFVLAHPEYIIPEARNMKLKILINRRIKHEPIAYILGQKEFYGLNFRVNRDVLVPRPETEMLVEEVLKLQPKNSTIIDIGTGSGNIIISLAKNLKAKNKFIAVDISPKALKIAKYNAKLHKVDKRIKFIKSDLLSNQKIFDNLTIQQFNYLTIIANLPYLSKEIYNSVSPDIKKYEPKSALFSPQNGLRHYAKLLKQLKKIKNKCSMLHVSCFMEFSPEQKPALQGLIKSVLSGAKLKFARDLAGKWRVAHISL